jgi:16S rRNA processing protein RimM
MEKELVEIGVIGAAHGLRGAVFVRLYNPSSSLLEPGTEVLISGQHNTHFLKVMIEMISHSPKGTKVKFYGIDDRDAAENINGWTCAVEQSQLPVLEEDEFYYRDIIGSPVFSTDDIAIGTIEDVFSAATDILVIKTTEGDELLVPVVDVFVISLTPGKVVVDLTGLETD